MIKTRQEAINAFIAEFPTLARTTNPAAPAYDGYNFLRYLIRLHGSEPFKAYVAHNTGNNTSYVVPLDGSTPSIEDFEDIEIIRTVTSPVQACEVFLQKYLPLAKTLNPQAVPYTDFGFEKKIIAVHGNAYKAYICANTDTGLTLVVPTGIDEPFVEKSVNIKVIK